jgi:hypothetical protein
MAASKLTINSYKHIVVKANSFADELTNHHIIARDLATPAQKLKSGLK